jgi:hypothetical protein
VILKIVLILFAAVLIALVLGLVLRRSRSPVANGFYVSGGDSCLRTRRYRVRMGNGLPC